MVKVRLGNRERKITLCNICGEHIGQGECGIQESVLTVTSDRHNKDEFTGQGVKKRRAHLCDLCTTSVENFIAQKRDEMKESALQGDLYDEMVESL